MLSEKYGQLNLIYWNTITERQIHFFVNWTILFLPLTWDDYILLYSLLYSLLSTDCLRKVRICNHVLSSAWLLFSESGCQREERIRRYTVYPNKNFIYSQNEKQCLPKAIFAFIIRIPWIEGFIPTVTVFFYQLIFEV